MKKVLGKKMENESGTLVSYACGCMCFASCSCTNTTYDQATVHSAQNRVNNVQNDNQLLLWS